MRRASLGSIGQSTAEARWPNFVETTRNAVASKYVGGRMQGHHRGLLTFVAVVAMASSACSSTAATHNASGRSLCTALGRQGGLLQTLNTPDRFLTSKVIASGQDARDTALRSAASALADARAAGDRNAVNSAEQKVQAACVRLGYWRTFH